MGGESKAEVNYLIIVKETSLRSHTIIQDEVVRSFNRSFAR